MLCARDRANAAGIRVRVRLLVLALLVAVQGCAVVGVTWTAALEARLTRSDDAVVVLNANDYEWRGVTVTIWDYTGAWHAEIDTLGPGESLRVVLRELDSETGPFVQQSFPDALVAVVVDDADGLAGKTLGRKLVELAMERQSRQPEGP